jgi:hypothetical protein
MDCTAEEKRQALDLALNSQTFARCDQLRAFLSFVCEAEARGAIADLTEYVIGVQALGRPEGYSTTEDSSVRTRAYELRHKLDRLYSFEAPDAPVRIVLPKGSYVPQFVKRPVSGDQALPGRTPHSERLGMSAGRAPRRRSALVFFLGIVAAAALGAAITWAVLRRQPAAPAVDPVLLEAWGALARPNANAILCVATPLNLIVTPAGHEIFGSRLYPVPPETYPLFREHRPLAPGAKLEMAFTDNVTGFGTMNAVITAARTLSAMGSSFQILPERVAPLSVLRNRHAILFGAPVDSDAVNRVLQDTPLTVDFEPSVKEFVIRDRQAGSMIVPKKDPQGDFIDVYGLITVLKVPGPDREQLSTVVFSGITSTGTHGAAEFFASVRSLQDLKARFAREGVRGFPAAYQVVVKCNFSNSLLVTDDYYSHRILRKE